MGPRSGPPKNVGPPLSGPAGKGGREALVETTQPGPPIRWFLENHGSGSGRKGQKKPFATCGSGTASAERLAGGSKRQRQALPPPYDLMFVSDWMES